MKLTINGQNLKITDSVEEYVQKKMGRLNRYLPSLKQGRVEIRREQTGQSLQRYTIQVTLYDAAGTILRGEERSTELSSAVDLVVDKMHRQIGRFKGKRRKGRNKKAQFENMLGQESSFSWEEEDEEEQEVVRVKRFAMSPMDADEAIEQMELLGHTFFVYYDADEGGVNVVYRRDDGNYGLIIPELA